MRDIILVNEQGRATVGWSKVAEGERRSVIVVVMAPRNDSSNGGS